MSEKPIRSDMAAEQERPETYYLALLAAGFERLPNNHPRNYTYADGAMMPTLERSGVRISMSSSTILYEDRGRVMAGVADDGSEWTINAILVDESVRREGLATRALQEVCQLADEYGIKLYLEPAPIFDKPVGRDALRAMYAKAGFVGDGVLMVRAAGMQEQNAPAAQRMRE